MTRPMVVLQACVLLCAVGALAQAAAAQDAYVFVSPNTRETLTDGDARASLTSFEELNGIAIADRTACSMASKVEITAALGIYDSSAENSFLIESNLKRDEAEYTGSLLSRYEHQKYVLLFFPQAAGHDRLWTIKTSKSFDAAIAAARQMRLTPVTLRPEAGGNEIWVVDIGNKFGDRPKQLAALLAGAAASQEGIAEILGDENERAKSAAIFDRRIAEFESRANRKLSSRLWTESWRDASTRTCSTEAPE
ncbi:MAG TPA: hypothetical protein VHX36_07640 [Candidatus Acidoferrales bacterium]|nr:hypothetical protein [Candidatus Acidoferrales bacterium]